MFEAPIFFERNRVSRVYTGGLLFRDLFGDPAEDGGFPEEWIASCVAAQTEDGKTEGISRVRGGGERFDTLLEKYADALTGGGKNTGVLVKALDSAVRLPVQTHPDRAFSEAHFNSKYGKAESWVILATRPNAKVYLGFNRAVTRAEFAALIERSETDKNAMEAVLNAFEVTAGDVFFIPARAVHAIGAGCLILEVQEPTDFTLQPERYCGDYRLSDYSMYLGIDKEAALDCFDYTFDLERVKRECVKKPRVTRQENGVTAETLISYSDTPCFAVNKYTVDGGAAALGYDKYAVYAVTRGSGRITGRNCDAAIQKGDYFFAPFCLKNTLTVTAEHLELIECLPPIGEPL
ncbi:MAG: class I mannose-6-phosphate isomerase [Clostridiales bacterium]|jgi:mannose-6-phosphate isomerase|nr:class I mannose-6-phosphate isomerase [Clostridiales bacterium]